MSILLGLLRQWFCTFRFLSEAGLLWRVIGCCDTNFMRVFL